MAEEEKLLIDYVLLTTNGYRLTIVNPTIEGNQSFEIKTGTINMIQRNKFFGTPNKDLNEHISNFIELCGTFQFHNIVADDICLWLFSLSIRDRAKSLLKSLPVDSITSWENICHEFLTKFFPFKKTALLRNEI